MSYAVTITSVSASLSRVVLNRCSRTRRRPREGTSGRTPGGQCRAARSGRSCAPPVRTSRAVSPPNRAAPRPRRDMPAQGKDAPRGGPGDHVEQLADGRLRAFLDLAQQDRGDRAAEAAAVDRQDRLAGPRGPFSVACTTSPFARSRRSAAGSDKWTLALVPATGNRTLPNPHDPAGRPPRSIRHRTRDEEAQLDGEHDLHGRSAVTGGRVDGHGRTSDGTLEVDLRLPTEMGGQGGGTNPEQLFAVGYAACFEGALSVAGRRAKVETATWRSTRKCRCHPTGEAASTSASCSTSRCRASRTPRPRRRSCAWRTRSVRTRTRRGATSRSRSRQRRADRLEPGTGAPAPCGS